MVAGDGLGAGLALAVAEGDGFGPGVGLPDCVVGDDVGEDVGEDVGDVGEEVGDEGEGELGDGDVVGGFVLDGLCEGVDPADGLSLAVLVSSLVPGLGEVLTVELLAGDGREDVGAGRTGTLPPRRPYGSSGVAAVWPSPL
ncbi:MAG: hypothetical protein ACRDN9_05030 [Streptosporangiaceae bacterium]